MGTKKWIRGIVAFVRERWFTIAQKRSAVTQVEQRSASVEVEM